MWVSREKIAGALTMIFASILATAKLPGEWGIAIFVSLLFKKDSRGKPDNLQASGQSCVRGKEIIRANAKG